MSGSTEYSSSRRSSTDSPPQDPASILEHHLKCLADSYISFFQERARIEEHYAQSLIRLHRKVKVYDDALDALMEPISIRHAWYELRDNLEREAQTRQAFVDTMTIDVISQLSAMKEVQERSHKRIKEDIKKSSAAYNEYAENVLPRLKRAYLKKCQEVDEHKAAAAMPPPAYQPTATTSPNPAAATPAMVTAPQPLRPLARRPSGRQMEPRERSPSASNTLQDLAHTGKRQLNQLMGFLDQKGKEGLVGRGEGAAKTVKAKREADEADKEYRQGVHWLETLRLRKLKTVEGGFKSVELFIVESSQILKEVFEKYSDNLQATSTTQAHLATHAKTGFTRLSAQRDQAFLAGIMNRYMHNAVPEPTLYHNYFVGDCADLVFGVGLVDYANSRSLQDGEIPKIIKLCIQEVDKRGLNSEGIYRVSGRHATVQDIIHRIEKDEQNFAFNPSTDDVFVVASTLKQNLRELPEPVFKFPLEERLKHTEDLDKHVSNNFLLLRGKMRRLPPVHQATLRAIVEHLARVASRSEKNKMDAKNLSIIFSGVIFGEDEPKNGDLLSMQSWKDSLMEDLITHAATLFDDNPSHPLPPAPTGEQPAPFNYGSSHTQVATVPFPSQREGSEGPEASTSPRAASVKSNDAPSTSTSTSTPPKKAEALPPPSTTTPPKKDEPLPPLPDSAKSTGESTSPTSTTSPTGPEQ